MGNEKTDLYDLAQLRTQRIEQQRMEANKILHYNRKRLYRIIETNKYSFLNEALAPEVRQFLLDLIAFWMKTKCIAFGSHDKVYFIGTKKGTYDVRKKQTTSVTNRYLNYLCALGLLKKIEQPIPKMSGRTKRRFMRKINISNVSRNIMRYKSTNIRAINTFDLVKYTPEVLKSCNDQAQRILRSGLTRGNISYNYLAINGLEDIAHNVYNEDKSFSVAKKEHEYDQLIECIDFLIKQKGYATKKDIFDNLCLDDSEINKLYVIFKKRLGERYNYKRPTNGQKEQFNLKNDNWIITKK